MPAYLVTEVDKHEVDEKGRPLKTKDKILKQCELRSDHWVNLVALRIRGAVSDLHASDARYHKDCLSRFFSNRCAPGEENRSRDVESNETPVRWVEKTYHRDDI